MTRLRLSVGDVVAAPSGDKFYHLLVLADTRLNGRLVQLYEARSAFEIPPTSEADIGIPRHAAFLFSPWFTTVPPWQVVGHLSGDLMAGRVVQFGFRDSGEIWRNGEIVQATPAQIERVPRPEVWFPERLLNSWFLDLPD